MGILAAHMSVCHVACCVLGSQKMITDSPGTEAAEGCESPSRYWDLTPALLEEPAPLVPPIFDFENWMRLS